MHGTPRSSIVLAGVVALAATVLAPSALAQEAAPPPPQAPPPAAYGPQYGPPPAGVYYAPPPPGYGPAYAPAPEAPYVIEDWEPGDPVPDGYREDSRIRKGLVIGGAATMGGAWLITCVVAGVGQSIEAVDDELEEGTGYDDGVSESDWAVLYIPVAGPFVAIATLDASGGGLAPLIVDGVVQSAGLAMLIAGLAAQDHRLVRVGDADIHVAPVAGAGEASLGLVGTF
jgi:hypothetical protein